MNNEDIALSSVIVPEYFDYDIEFTCQAGTKVLLKLYQGGFWMSHNDMHVLQNAAELKGHSSAYKINCIALFKGFIVPLTATGAPTTVSELCCCLHRCSRCKFGEDKDRRFHFYSSVYQYHFKIYYILVISSFRSYLFQPNHHY